MSRHSPLHNATASFRWTDLSLAASDHMRRIRYETSHSYSHGDSQEEKGGGRSRGGVGGLERGEGEKQSSRLPALVSVVRQASAGLQTHADREEPAADLSNPPPSDDAPQAPVRSRAPSQMHDRAPPKWLRVFNPFSTSNARGREEEDRHAGVGGGGGGGGLLPPMPLVR